MTPQFRNTGENQQILISFDADHCLYCDPFDRNIRLDFAAITRIMPLPGPERTA
jgi:hypothetical protein